MQQYLSLNVLSLEESRESKKYQIKITNSTTQFTTQIENQFKHGFQYVYQLWACRQGDKHKISIHVSTLVEGKYTKIGVASPEITHTTEGEKYKFYGPEDSQNQIVFTFKVIKLNVPADNSQIQRLKNINQKMQKYLKHCKAELRGYKQFLEHTNNFIKELNKEEDMFQKNIKSISQKKDLQEESQQYRFRQSTSEYDQDNFEQKIDKSFDEDQSRQPSNKGTKISKRQLKPSRVSEPASHDTPINKLKTKQPLKSQRSQKQMPVKSQQPSIKNDKNESKSQSQVTRNKSSKKQSKVELMRQAQPQQKQSKIQVVEEAQPEQKQTSEDVSNQTSKISTKSKDFMNQLKKKRSVLTKFSYLEKQSANKPKAKVKNEVKQQSQESDTQIAQKYLRKTKQVKRNEGSLSNKFYQNLKEAINTTNQKPNESVNSKNNAYQQKSEQSWKDDKIKNMAEEIRKRRDAYTNLVNKQANETMQSNKSVYTPKTNKSVYMQDINVIPQTAEDDFTKPNTPIANLKISSATPIQSEVSRYRQPSSRKVSQFKDAIKKSSPKFADSGSNHKQNTSKKKGQTKPQTNANNQQAQKQSEYNNSINSSYKLKISLPGRHQLVTQQEQNETTKTKYAETATNQTEMRNTQMQKMQSSHQIKMVRRKKHVRSNTEACKQSVAGSFHHIQRIHKNSNALKQSQERQNFKKQILNLKKLTLRILSIKITTFTIFEGRSKRCLLQNGDNKFQTSVKQSNENSVEWEDKIVIKNIQPHSCLNLSLISNNFKNSVTQGTAIILFDQLIASGSRHHKAYIYKDNLAIGNLQFKYSIEEQEHQRLTFSLPQIKKQEQELPSKSHKISKFDSFEGVDRLIVNDVKIFEGKSNRSLNIQNSTGQNPPTYKSRIRTEKERRHRQHP